MELNPRFFFASGGKHLKKIASGGGLLSFFEQLSFEISGSRTAGGRMLLNEKPSASALTVVSRPFIFLN
jgi:hypothetical protein